MTNSQTATEKLARALSNLKQLNRQLHQLEYTLARQHARCQEVTRDMQRLNQSLVRPASKR